MNLATPKVFPTRSIWVYVVFILALCIMPFLWFTFGYIFSFVQAIGRFEAASLGTNDTQYGNADLFFTYLAQFILVIGLVFAGIWTLVQAQHRGQPIAYG